MQWQDYKDLILDDMQKHPDLNQYNENNTRTNIQELWLEFVEYYMFITYEQAIRVNKFTYIDEVQNQLVDVDMRISPDDILNPSKQDEINFKRSLWNQRALNWIQRLSNVHDKKEYRIYVHIIMQHGFDLYSLFGKLEDLSQSSFETKNSLDTATYFQHTKKGGGQPHLKEGSLTEDESSKKKRKLNYLEPIFMRSYLLQDHPNLYNRSPNKSPLGKRKWDAKIFNVIENARK